MSTLFDRFSMMIDKLPPKGVIKAVELERRMVEEDMAHKRTLPLEEARSILNFSHFLQAALDKTPLPQHAMPGHHLSFYRKTVERLIEGGELPPEAEEMFNKTFFLRTK